MASPRPRSRSLDRQDGGDPVARARELVPRVREFADQAERDRHLPAAVAEALALAGLHRVAAPLALGGAECEPPVQIETIETIAAADGSTGWNLMIGIEILGSLGAALDLELARKLFADRGLIVSGAINPVATARREAGGLRVSGTWPFGSGCHNAHYFWGQCVVHDSEGPLKGSGGGPVLREVLLERDEFEILDTWNVSGLRGSGSHDVAVCEVLVPEERTTAIFETQLRPASTLYRLPPFTRLAYNKVGVATGIARGAIDHFVELASRHTRRASGSTLAERADVQLAVADAETTLRSARAFVIDAVGEVWRVTESGREASPRERALVQLACANACAASVRAVDRVCEMAGTRAIFASNPLERCQRDVRVVPQHITVSNQWNAGAGRVLLGMDSGLFFF